MAKFIGFQNFARGLLNLRFLGAPGPGQSWPIGKSVTDMKTLWKGDIWLKCLQMESNNCNLCLSSEKFKLKALGI